MLLVGIFFTVRKQSLRRLCFHRCLNVLRGGACVVGWHAWQGACVTGGPCVAGGGIVAGDMHGGHAWQGGVHDRGHV